MMTGLAALAAGAAFAATNGTYWNAESSCSRTTGEASYWLKRTVAGDGGIATFADTPSSQTLKNTISGWTLGGLALNGFSAQVTGNPISLTGQAAVDASGSPTFFCAIQAAEAAATLAKSGPGTITLAAPLSGFGGVTLLNGVLASTNAQGSVVSDSPVTVVNGTLKWAPSFGGTGEAAVGALGRDTLKVKGNAEVNVEKGNAATVTLTLPTLDLSENNPVLKIVVTGGSAALGESVKVLVSGTVPEVTNGLVDPRIVSRAADTGRSLTFLTHDAEKGFVPAAANGSVTDADAATKIVRIASDTALPANARAGALVVEGKPSVTGAGITVGDGVHPAGVIFNEATGGKTDFSKAGTISFGDAPGVVWQGNKNTGDANIWSPEGGSVVLPPIAGTKGVTFAAAKEAGFCSFCSGSDNKTAAQWSGPTRIAGSARFQHNSASCLPQGDVFVEGGELYTVSDLIYTGRHFHFSGKCRPNGSSYKTGGAPSIYFDCPVTLEDVMTVAHDNDGSSGSGIRWTAGAASRSSTPGAWRSPRPARSRAA